MPIVTRKSNVDSHPSRIVLENQQTRRNRKQIEEDAEHASVEANQAKEEASAKHHAVLVRIAEL